MDIDWNKELVEQLDWHWQNQLRPRLAGLTDDEYFWEPVAGCWSVRPRDQATTDQVAGSGEFVLEFAFPEPAPAPVTTIAWQLGHIVGAVFAERNAKHFGGRGNVFRTFDYAGTAARALSQLDEAYATWIGGVRQLGAEGLARPCGPSEGPYADYPLAALVLHINREVIHHGAEISLLRDIYQARGQQDGI
jgi:DinB family protein